MIYHRSALPGSTALDAATQHGARQGFIFKFTSALQRRASRSAASRHWTDQNKARTFKMWTPGIVMARYMEAADTERFLSSGGLATGAGYWPAFLYDEEDRKGWDDMAKADNAAKFRGRAADGTISRHWECHQWTIDHIDCEKRRHILWTWAFCKANGWDFGAKCKRRGWARPTAYRRLTDSFERIATRLGNAGEILKLPADKWLSGLRQEPHAEAMNSGRVEQKVSAEIKQIKPGYRTEPHRDLLTTPEAVADFAAFLEKRNAREAKRRARLGMDAA